MAALAVEEREGVEAVGEKGKEVGLGARVTAEAEGMGGMVVEGA